MNPFFEKIGRIFSGAAGGIITSIGDTVDKFVTTKDEREALKVALLQLQQERDEKLRASLLDEFRAEMADRDSARRREVDIAKTAKSDWFMKLSGLIALAAFIVVEAAFILDHKLELGLEHSTGFHQLVGQIEGVFATIYAFYYGTSKSSSDKNQIISKQNEQGNSI